MGLPVGIIIQGKGTTHDGNLARRFFENSKKSSEITGLNENLISMCNTILKALSSGYAVDSSKFYNYSLELANLYVNEYSWYPMPASVHKILIHGHDILKSALLPIGMMSEEAQEARNKDFRNYREKFTRKISRVHTNEDILHMFLISSDPVISSLRKLPSRKSGSMPQAVIDLLEDPSASSCFIEMEN
nr:uncharacterized protein LOC122269457 [Parasteatoda tepidariorum]